MNKHFSRTTWPEISSPSVNELISYMHVKWAMKIKPLNVQMCFLDINAEIASNGTDAASLWLTDDNKGSSLNIHSSPSHFQFITCDFCEDTNVCHFNSFSYISHFTQYIRVILLGEQYIFHSSGQSVVRDYPHFRTAEKTCAHEKRWQRSVWVLPLLLYLNDLVQSFSYWEPNAFNLRNQRTLEQATVY